MAAVGRIENRLRLVGRRHERLLVLYLTLGDPLSAELASVALRAGVDMIEFGLVTPSNRPRGAAIRQSFERAGTIDPEQSWQLLAQVRAQAPEIPLLLLTYPETVADLGLDRLVIEAAAAGADAIVATAPAGQDEIDRITGGGLSYLPLIRSDAAEQEVRRLEAAAQHLTYRNLAPGTGQPLDLAGAQRRTAELAATATKPFLAGFGLRDDSEIRALAPDVAGVVIGSRLLEIALAAEPAHRAETVVETVRRWKAATVLTELAERR